MEMSAETNTAPEAALEPAPEPDRARAGAPLPSVPAPRLPWPSLVVLAFATLVMVTGEMLPTAVLPQMGASLGVGEDRIGLLVALWAGTVVVASPLLVGLVRGRDRRAVIVVALVVFAASGVIVAAADTYAVAVAGRLLGAAACGLLWSTVNVHTADVVPERELGRAISVVIGGATLGIVVGVPLTSAVARAWDWRAAFGGLAVLALVAAVLVRVVVVRAPDAPAVAGAAGEAVPEGDPSGVGQRRGALRALVTVTVLVAVVLVGHFATYTFVTRLLAEPAGAVPGGISGLLLVFGVASAAGVVVAGRAGDRWPAAALPVASAMAGLALLALLGAGHSAAAALLVVIAWGMATGALPPLAQTTILRLAGSGLRGIAGMLIPVVFNLGIAVGAAAGSAVVDRSGPWAVPLPSALLVAVAAVALSVLMRRLGAPRHGLARR
ncbi:MFS transporter [Antribacter sp. KLBMP9083]|uniref:MFS transporter n=1 Tax=Antribacter soli TaxID=2910976 RepID=A0AA41QIV3_9MICO|nr:MFS transporter [Antribacter soli]MCF4122919.1 MFS transporter [Antribacter soli]